MFLPNSGQPDVQIEIRNDEEDIGGVRVIDPMTRLDDKTFCGPHKSLYISEHDTRSHFQLECSVRLCHLKLCDATIHG